MLRLTPARALPPLLCLLLLTACGGGPPRVVQAPRLVIPDSLQTCAPQPEPPAPGADDTDLSNFILDLAAAGEDCRGKLAAAIKVVGQPPAADGRK